MRVLKAIAGMLAVGGLVLGAAPQVWAQTPKLDVAQALAALADQQVYRAPGAVAYLDEDRVLPALKDDTRVLVAPYSGTFEKGGNYADGDAHYEQVGKKLDDWATKHHLHLIFVEGINVTLYGEPGAGIGPSDVPELRQVTAYLDVSTAVIFAARYAAGMPEDKAADFDYPKAEPVQPTQDQVDDLAAKLQADPVYNAPGRDDPVYTGTARLAQKTYGITVRIAAFPVLQPDQKIVDYAPELLKRFPDDVIMVVQGRWLDVAATQQSKADSARDYAYGRYENSSFTQGSLMQDRIGTVLDRLQFLLKDTAYGRPQPQPQPRPQPYDVRRTISGLAPWALVGAALVLGGAGLYTWRRGHRDRADAERRAMRRENATALAKIGELSAQLLAVEERGDTVNPAAAERLATARALYDQALTAKAMAEVAAIADEGVEAGVTV